MFAAPFRCRSPGYLVLYRNNQLGYPRLGLAISKKCARRAVDRARLKRVARESFRLNRFRLGGWDIVVLCVSNAPMLSNLCLFDSLARVWATIEKQACGES